MKADLHIHTFYSYDSLSSPKEVVNTALKRHIDCLCITDHGKIKGAIEVLRIAFDKNILIIPGIEIKSNNGDILGIGIKKIIPNKLSPEETIKKIHQAGGIASVAHPFGFACSFSDDISKYKFDAIEIFNASVFDFNNAKAEKISKKLSLPGTAGSDSHDARSIGMAYVKIEGDNLSEKEVIQKILNKKTSFYCKKTTLSRKIIDHTRRAGAKITHLFPSNRIKN